MQQPDYCLFWIDSWVTCMPKSEWATWVQAIGSVLAIVFSVWVVTKQHNLELRRQKVAELAKALAHRRGVVQLVDGICAVAKKIQVFCLNCAEAHKKSAEELHLGLRSLGNAMDELEAVVNAVAGVDHLQFEEHSVIESLIVAESSGRVLLKVGKRALTLMEKDGQSRWDDVTSEASRVVEDIRKRTDALHATNVARAKAL